MSKSGLQKLSRDLNKCGENCKMEKLGTKHKTLDNVIYKRLKSMIIERKLKPGEKIYQDKLADDLGVSRTPLVSALKKLEHEKLINGIPRRGFFVRDFSKREMIHIFELREVLEGLAARKASTRITDGQIQRLDSFFSEFKTQDDLKDCKKYREEDRRFHNFLLEIGGEEILSSMLETYNILTLAYQFRDREGLVRPPEETIHEHRALIKAVCDKDPTKAEELARLHIKLSIDKMIRDLEQEDTGTSHEAW